MKRKFYNVLTAGLVVTTMFTTLPSGIFANASTKASIGYYQNDEDYKLVFEDNFDGNALDMTNWNYETHEPGWVNNELQAYTDSTDNIFVKDGSLVLKAIKTETEEGTSYTSGKVTTQYKQDFKYGKMEARIKVPKGQGLWPAFWMMPTEEGLYGQWPKCGEIDIMEVLGHQPEKAFGTIHYGEPHREQQGVYELEGETFADDYHVFAVEWEPSEMRFYIDGNLYHTVNDWFTKKEGDDEITYPAPFDQPFFLQFNLAVGGNWPGNPDETTDFDNAELKVDYVKVYQKDSYNENVSKPVKPPVIFREPDATGNYINNGDFSVNEDLTDDRNWKLLNALGGVGTGTISGNKLLIESENEGTVDYSIQLVQPDIPLKQMGEYEISFDAKAAENRSMVINVTSPDRGYIRHFADTVVDLTTTTKNYSYTFTMKDEDDGNGRLEFNFGNQGSLADVELTNVKVKKIGQGVVVEPSKTLLSDGNYVYNGTFDVGADRMKYWTVNNKVEGATVSVTNVNNVRELKVDSNNVPQSLQDISIKEEDLGISKNTEYIFSFDAYADKDKTIKATIDGNTFEANITTDKQTYKYALKTGDVLNNADLEFLLGQQGVTYIDNIKIVDSDLLINGDFSKDLSKWEVFADSSISAQVNGGIEEVSTGNNAAKIEIGNSGAADWNIQLKQNDVKLLKGKKYRLSLDAKSTMARAIQYTLQKNGGDWYPYAGTNIIELTDEFKTYSKEFLMDQDTDLHSILSISMGAVNGIQITDKHTVYIDNVKLEEVTDEVADNVVTDALLETLEKVKELVNSEKFKTANKEDAENIMAILAMAEALYNDAVSGNATVTQKDIDDMEAMLAQAMENVTYEDNNSNGGNGPSDENNNGAGNNGENNGTNDANKDESNSVKTSDSSNTLLLTSMLLLSGAVVLSKCSKKKKQGNI